MIVVVDTSGLVKLFVDEPGSAEARAMLGSAVMIAASRIAYAEAMAAFGRRHREGALDEAGLESMIARLDRTWSRVGVVDIDERAAGRLAIAHGIRGLDAIHLAAALRIRGAMPQNAVRFLTFDQRQAAAAVAEGLAVGPWGLGARHDEAAHSPPTRASSRA